MKIIKILIPMLVIVSLSITSTETAYADVYAFYVRVTQPDTEAPFDGSFADGSGAKIRFMIQDTVATTDVIVRIKSGATVIKTLSLTNIKGGDHGVDWNGSTDAGTAAPAGAYTIEITTSQTVGHSAYRLIYDAGADAVGLSTRGVTVLTNPQFKNFGFAYAVTFVGGAPWNFAGVGRVAANGTLFGDTRGNAQLTTTGIPLNILNRRFSPTTDVDGYIYVVGRDERKIFRFHPDTLLVTQFIDTVATAGLINGIYITGSDSSKYLWIASTTEILGAPIGTSSHYTGPITSLIPRVVTTFQFWDVLYGDGGALYVVINPPTQVGGSTVVKFDMPTPAPKTVADTVWSRPFVDGDAVALDIWRGATTAATDDILYVTVDRAGGASDLSGIYALSNLTAPLPTRVLAFADPDNNTTRTRGKAAVDYAGNLIYFENSNEQIMIVSPPNGPNTSTLTAPLTFLVATPGLVFPILTIAQAKIDTAGGANFIPDRLNDTVTVSGIVTSINFTLSAGRLSYYFQDHTGGMNVNKAATTTPVLNLGDSIRITGRIGQFRGTTQIEPLGIPPTISLDVLATGRPLPAVQVITIPQYLANPEFFEGRFIKIENLRFARGTWPAANQNQTVYYNHGTDTIIVFLDLDTDIDGQPRPIDPVSIQGIATQFTSAATVYNDGYQISPRFYTDFSKFNLAPSVFNLLSPVNNGRIMYRDSVIYTYDFNWHRSTDPNQQDTVRYIWRRVGTGISIPSNNFGLDTALFFTWQQIRTFLGILDSVTFKWTVYATDGMLTTWSADSFTVTIVRDKGVGVDDKQIPNVFFVDQNYPNPFNPNTIIRFGLPKANKVDLIVYNILGEVVAKLVNGVFHEAGEYKINFDASKLASGMYIYQFIAGDFKQTKKMLLVK